MKELFQEIIALWRMTDFPLFIGEIIAISFFVITVFIGRKKIGSLLIWQFSVTYFFFFLLHFSILNIGQSVDSPYTVLAIGQSSIWVYFFLPTWLLLELIWLEKKWQETIYDHKWNGFSWIILSRHYLLFTLAILLLLYSNVWLKPNSASLWKKIWPFWEAVLFAFIFASFPIIWQISYRFAEKRHQGPYYSAAVAVLWLLPLSFINMFFIQLSRRIFG